MNNFHDVSIEQFKDQLRNEKANARAKRQILKNKKLQYNIPQNCPVVILEDGFSDMKNAKLYIWVENENLCFFPAVVQENENYYNTCKIPISDIEYYATEGNISK